MKTRSLYFLVMTLLSGLTFLNLAPVHAHETRQVGNYKLTVGWVTEPPVTGERNAVEMTVTNATNQPVLGLQNTLGAKLIYGPATLPLQIEAQEENGTYAGAVVLTKAGTYNVTVSGTIGTQQVNEKFQLDTVVDRIDLEFPTQEPSPTSLQNSVNDASGKANMAMNITYAGIAVGLVGILTGVVAYRRKLPSKQ